MIAMQQACKVELWICRVKVLGPRLRSDQHADHGTLHRQTCSAGNGKQLGDEKSITPQHHTRLLSGSSSDSRHRPSAIACLRIPHCPAQHGSCTLDGNHEDPSQRSKMSCSLHVTCIPAKTDVMAAFKAVSNKIHEQAQKPIPRWK